MIRIAIERVQYVLIEMKDGQEVVQQYTDTCPEVTGQMFVRKSTRTLLVQEFDNLSIAPIVALLNQLKETPLCACGHPKHEGPCRVIVSPNNTLYGNDKACDCEHYRTTEQALLEGMAKKAAELDAKMQVTLAKSNADLKRAVERQSELLDEVNRITRSRDRLLSKGRKR